MEKYFKLLGDIEKEKIDITKLYLLSSFQYSLDNEKDEWKAVNYCYDLWLMIDVDVSLSRLADIVADRWEEIKINKISKKEIIDILLDY